MPIQSAEWLVPKRVIYAYAWGKVTPDDMVAHNARMLELIESGTPLVHVILNSKDGMEIANPSLRAGMDQLSFIRRDDLGFTIQVRSLNPIAKSSSILMAKVTRVRFRMVDSMDEAISFLTDYDATVDWTTANMSLIDR